MKSKITRERINKRITFRRSCKDCEKEFQPLTKYQVYCLECQRKHIKKGIEKRK
jgi:hypothetical protein